MWSRVGKIMLDKDAYRDPSLEDWPSNLSQPSSNFYEHAISDHERLQGPSAKTGDESSHPKVVITIGFILISKFHLIRIFWWLLYREVLPSVVTLVVIPWHRGSELNPTCSGILSVVAPLSATLSCVSGSWSLVPMPWETPTKRLLNSLRMS